jgi:hypothetical protein
MVFDKNVRWNSDELVLGETIGIKYLMQMRAKAIRMAKVKGIVAFEV